MLKVWAEQDRKGEELLQLDSETSESIPLARRLGGDRELVSKYGTIVNTDCVTELLIECETGVEERTAGTGELDQTQA